MVMVHHHTACGVIFLYIYKCVCLFPLRSLAVRMHDPSSFSLPFSQLVLVPSSLQKDCCIQKVAMCRVRGAVEICSVALAPSTRIV